jgi:hypothetical protein
VQVQAPAPTTTTMSDDTRRPRLLIHDLPFDWAAIETQADVDAFVKKYRVLLEYLAMNDDRYAIAFLRSATKKSARFF